MVRSRSRRRRHRGMRSERPGATDVSVFSSALTVALGGLYTSTRSLVVVLIGAGASLVAFGCWLIVRRWL